MSAFSRGLILRPRYPFSTPKNLTLQYLMPSKSTVLRSLTTSHILRHAIQKARKSTLKLANGTIKKSTSQPPVYQSFAESLAAKPTSTLLYAAPPHTLYMISCYSGAVACFGYASYNFNAIYMHPPPDIKPWIPIAFGVVCFGMACFGGYLLFGPARLVKTITALPSSHLEAQALWAKGTRAASQKPGLAIEIELRKMLPIPFFPARKVLAKQEDVTLNHRVYVPPDDSRQTAAERMEAQRRLERELYEEQRKSIWLRPFRDANKLFYKLFRSMRLAWARDSFLELAVKGSKYKLDVGGGWGLDEGRALDRLFRLKAPN